MMGMIFKIDASWAEKLTKMRVSFLMTPTVWVLEMASVAVAPLHSITIRNKNIYLFLVGSFAGSSI